VNPALFQLNPRTYLSTIGDRTGTLDDIPDSLLHTLASRGVDWLWLLGVWTMGPTSRAISRSLPNLRQEFLHVLPDLTEDDICGSPFAIARYETDAALGGDKALARFRNRLREHGMRLLLDFVPNHIGLDHSWTRTHPDYLIEGTEEQLINEPDSWIRLRGESIFAHGRDPNFAGWTDTLQLNYFNPKLHQAMVAELHAIAERADGVRCDMAMLLEPEVFLRTWGTRVANVHGAPPPFWPDAIRSIRDKHPKFLFLAEVYWNYEFTLQQHGFDYTYDKTLYDRVLQRRGPEVRSHLTAPLSYQKHLARFLENHDEPRIASLLSANEHRAAAVITFMSPGLRFFHDGQFAGKRHRVPVHLARGPREKVDPTIEDLYTRILPIINSPTNKHGAWHLLNTQAAWPNNPTHENFITFLIEHPLRTLLVAVNYASYRGQCFIRIPDRDWLDGSIELRDLLSHEQLVRDASDLRERGLFLDCADWQAHIFSVEHP
jgi:glycosidase